MFRIRHKNGFYTEKTAVYGKCVRGEGLKVGEI